MWTLHINNGALLTHRSLWRLLRRARVILDNNIMHDDVTIKRDIAKTGHYRCVRVHIFRAY